MRAGRSFAVVLGVALLSAASAAQTPAPLHPIQFTDTRLANGLRVIISEDRFAPVYAIAVSYGVGSKDERPGRTGFAHLFEHMMFKGSDNVGPGEHFFLADVVKKVVKVTFVELEGLSEEPAVSKKNWLPEGLVTLSTVPCRMSRGRVIWGNSTRRRSSARTIAATVLVG